MLVPTSLIKKWQRFAETFQKVTQRREIAGCFRLASSSTSKNSGDSKNCQGSDKALTDVEEQHEKRWRDPSNPERVRITIKLIPRNLKPFHVQNSESTHEPRRGQLARKREKERVSCQQMPKPARHHGGNRKENLSLKVAFSKLWGYQAGLQVVQGVT